MTLNTELLFGKNPAAGGYQIERSLRFNSSDSAYLSRTPASAGNRRTYTYSAWVKRAAIGSGTYYLFTAVDGSNVDIIGFEADRFYWYNSFSGSVNSQALYRDPSAWYHVLASVDSTQAVATDRVKLYVNGAEVAYNAVLYPSLNRDFAVNNTVAHKVGQYFTTNSSNFYLADIHFIDGQALDPTSFGEFDANGVWQPKAYTGTYPGNSFHLDFADNSAATTAGIGKDVSGNGNDWTPVNLSVAAGAGNDSLVDTPTSYGVDDGLGGSVRGNYATWGATYAGAAGLSNGNLDFLAPTTMSAFGSISVTSGKWYWEILNSGTGLSYVGIMDSTITSATDTSWSTQSRAYVSGGSKYNGSNSPYGSSWAAGDVIGLALDLDSNSLTFYKNGVSQGVAFSTGLIGKEWKPFVYGSSGSGCSANFGQRPFAYPAPSGFKALCTTNLPEPQTITTSGTYTGNGVADGPFVYLNGVPTAMTVNGNAVTFGTEADRLSNGLKVRTTSTTYNQNAVVYNYSITSTGDPFKRARAQSNP